MQCTLYVFICIYRGSSFSFGSAIYLRLPTQCTYVVRTYSRYLNTDRQILPIVWAVMYILKNAMHSFCKTRVSIRRGVVAHFFHILLLRLNKQSLHYTATATVPPVPRYATLRYCLSLSLSLGDIGRSVDNFLKIRITAFFCVFWFAIIACKLYFRVYDIKHSYRVVVTLK